MMCLVGLDSLSSDQLVSRLRSHGIGDALAEHSDGLRQQLLSHLLNCECLRDGPLPAACEQIQSLLVSDSDDEQKSARIQLLKALPPKMALKALRCVLQLLGIPYEPGAAVSKLRRLFKKYLRELTVGSKQPAARPRHVRREEHRAAATAALQTVASDWPSVVSADLKTRLLQAFRDATSVESLSVYTCACCAESCPQSTQHIMKIAELPVDLLSCPSLPAESFSSLPALPQASSVPLDPRGVLSASNEVRLCSSCFSSLRHDKLPACALANNMVLGSVPPELADLTPIEESMIALCRAKATIFQLRPSGHDDENSSAGSDIHLPNLQRGMKGHVIIHPQHTEYVVDALPPPIADIVKPVCIIFVGSSPPSREWLLAKAKPLAVSRERVLRALNWLKLHNYLYRDIRIDHDVLAAIPADGLLPFTISTVPPSSAQEALTSRYDMIPGMAQLDQPSASPADSAPVVFPSVVITDVDGSAPSNELRAAAFGHVKERGGAFIGIPHDRAPANEFFNPSLFPKTFPTLFPYGIGGFEDETRLTSISLKHHVRHLLRLTDRRFQEHPSFLFIVFNMLQRREVLLRSSLKVRKSSFHAIAEEFSLISSEVLQRICERLASDASNDDSIPEDEKRALRLMKEVNLVTAAVPGSASSKLNMRNELRAAMIEHGIPSFYITINPADVHSPVLRFLAGDQVEIDNWLESTESTYWSQSNRIAQNPFVAASFFDVYMKAFISCLLGHKSGSVSAASDGGILGHVKSYFGYEDEVSLPKPSRARRVRLLVSERIKTAANWFGLSRL